MNINILGYGTMAKQIAALFFLGGHNITIWNHNFIENDDAVKKQIRLLNKFISTHKSGTINFVKALNELDDNVTIESVSEDLKIKQDVYLLLKNTVTKGYFSNSSSYTPIEIGETVGSLHFFNPLSLKIIEYYPPSIISQDVQDVLDFLTTMNYEIITVKNNRGFIGNFIIFNEISSVLKLIEKYNYNVSELNTLYRSLYQSRNVFSIIDMIGVDVVYKILINLKEHDDTLYLPVSLQMAIDKNVLGKKNKTSIISILQSYFC